MIEKKSRMTAFFAALCLFFSAVEFAIPKPLPFMRIGLANLPIMLSFLVFERKEILKLVMFKIIGQGVISGTIFSYVFLFSVAGSVGSALSMYLVFIFFYRRNVSGFVGMSVCGALMNNCAQIVLAKYILFGDNVRYVAPVLLITGLISGIILGVFAENFVRKSTWYGGLKK